MNENRDFIFSLQADEVTYLSASLYSRTASFDVDIRSLRPLKLIEYGRADDERDIVVAAVKSRRAARDAMDGWSYICEEMNVDTNSGVLIAIHT